MRATAGFRASIGSTGQLEGYALAAVRWILLIAQTVEGTEQLVTALLPLNMFLRT
jgi:hypothetical protein